MFCKKKNDKRNKCLYFYLKTFPTLSLFDKDCMWIESVISLRKWSITVCKDFAKGKGIKMEKLT